MRVLFAGGWRGQLEGHLHCWARHPLLAGLLAPLRNATWLMALGRSLIHPLPFVRVSVPVISVGNLTVGGTGKTPLTKWLVQRLLTLGHRPAVLTPLAPNADEVMEHALGSNQKGEASIFVLPGRNRLANAQKAIDGGATVLVLDDGFQYRQLMRDVDIVLWDATVWLHPANPLLREPLSALSRCSMVVISKADGVSHEKQQELRQQLNEWARGEKVKAAFGYEPVGIFAVTQSGAKVEEGFPCRVVATTSVANPFYFALTARRAGCEVAALVRYPDHYWFTKQDAAFVARIARDERATAVLTTQKDAVKWLSVWNQPIPLWVLRVQLKWLWGESALWQEVMSALTRKSRALGKQEAELL